MFKRRLLVMEDDAHVANVIGIIAESCGLEARIIRDHRRFFAAVDHWKPTHISLDLVLPGSDGGQILAELARRESGAKIIITSGSSDRVLDAAGADASQSGLHIIGVLAKPFSVAALRKVLSQAGGPPRELAPGLAPELALDSCLS